MSSFRNLRVKVVAKRNLQMSDGKLAAQSVHAVLELAALYAPLTKEELHEMANLTCVVLQASNQKFEAEKKRLGPFCVVFKDAGFTEVEPETETCLVYLEKDPKAEERDPTFVAPPYDGHDFSKSVKR